MTDPPQPVRHNDFCLFSSKVLTHLKPCISFKITHHTVSQPGGAMPAAHDKHLAPNCCCRATAPLQGHALHWDPLIPAGGVYLYCVQPADPSLPPVRYSSCPCMPKTISVFIFSLPKVKVCDSLLQWLQTSAADCMQSSRQICKKRRCQTLLPLRIEQDQAAPTVPCAMGHVVIKGTPYIAHDQIWQYASHFGNIASVTSASQRGDQKIQFASHRS